MATQKKWMQKAVQKPGALRKSVGVKPGQKIPVSTLDSLAKKPGITGKRARLALTFRKFNHGGK